MSELQAFALDRAQGVESIVDCGVACLDEWQPERAFAQDDWIAGDPSTVFGEVVQRACHAAGFEPRIAHRAEDLAIQQALVKAGFGVALMPSLTGVKPCPGVVLTSITEPGLSRHIYAVTRRGADQRPEIAALLRSLAGRARAFEQTG